MPSSRLKLSSSKVVNWARAFQVGFEPGLGPAWAWILKSCRASIEPDARAKSRFSASDRVFAIVGVKQREHFVTSVAVEVDFLFC